MKEPPPLLGAFLLLEFKEKLQSSSASDLTFFKQL